MQPQLADLMPHQAHSPLSHPTTQMAEINRTVKELWQKTYRNSDIDYIQVRLAGGAQPYGLPAAARAAIPVHLPAHSGASRSFHRSRQTPRARQRARTTTAW